MIHKDKKWIAVEDRLPKHYGMFLVCAKNGTWEENKRIAYLSESSKRFYAVDGMAHPAERSEYERSITHWMELPVKPQNENSRTMDDLIDEKRVEPPRRNVGLFFEDRH